MIVTGLRLLRGAFTLLPSGSAKLFGVLSREIRINIVVCVYVVWFDLEYLLLLLLLFGLFHGFICLCVD